MSEGAERGAQGSAHLDAEDRNERHEYVDCGWKSAMGWQRGKAVCSPSVVNSVTHLAFELIVLRIPVL